MKWKSSMIIHKYTHTHTRTHHNTPHCQLFSTTSFTENLDTHLKDFLTWIVIMLDIKLLVGCLFNIGALILYKNRNQLHPLNLVITWNVPAWTISLPFFHSLNLVFNSLNYLPLPLFIFWTVFFPLFTP